MQHRSRPKIALVTGLQEADHERALVDCFYVAGAASGAGNFPPSGKLVGAPKAKSSGDSRELAEIQVLEPGVQHLGRAVLNCQGVVNLLAVGINAL